MNTRSLMKGLALAGLLAATTAIPAAAKSGLAGAYLAGRAAAANHDFQDATLYLTQALIRDPSNVRLMERLVLAHVALGDVERAVPVARKLEATGAVSQVAKLVLVASERAAGRPYQRHEGAGQLINDLTAAWAQVGEGKANAGMESFDAIIGTEGLDQFGRYHKAMAQALIGDLEGADATLTGDAPGAVQLSRRGVIAHAEIRAALEDVEGAETLLSMLGSQDAAAQRLRARMAADTPVEFTRVRSAVEVV